MKVILKKDIVIKAGTEFFSAAKRTERSGKGHVQCGFGLTKDSSGSVNYFLEPLDLEVGEWFEIREK